MGAIQNAINNQLSATAELKNLSNKAPLQAIHLAKTVAKTAIGLGAAKELNDAKELREQRASELHGAQVAELKSRDKLNKAKAYDLRSQGRARNIKTQKLKDAMSQAQDSAMAAQMEMKNKKPSSPLTKLPPVSQMQQIRMEDDE